jgi:hypothetical protein
MKVPILIGALFVLYIGYPRQLLAQSADQTIQQTGNCSVVNLGNGMANFNCISVDAKVAAQMQAILNGIRRNESAAKDISEKLNRIIAQMSGNSFGNLKTRCIGVANDILDFYHHREEERTKYPGYPNLSQDLVTEWVQSSDLEFRRDLLPKVQQIHDEFANSHIRDIELDNILNRDEEMSKYRSAGPGQPGYGASWISPSTIYSIRFRLLALADKIPE